MNYCKKCDKSCKALVKKCWIRKLERDKIEKRIEFIVKHHQNPYPKDIFMWNNPEKLDFKRGRFNEFTHGVVERMREDILKEIKEIFREE